MRPTHCSAMFLGHLAPQPSPDLRAKFYGDRPRGIPPSGLNARGVAKYSDVRHVEGYISVPVQDMASRLIGNHTVESNGTTPDPLGQPIIRDQGPQFGTPFIFLKLMELGRSNLTCR